MTQIDLSQRLYPFGIISGLSAILIFCCYLMSDQLYENEHPSLKRLACLSGISAIVTILGLGYHFSILLVGLPTAGLLILCSLKRRKNFKIVAALAVEIIPMISIPKTKDSLS